MKLDDAEKLARSMMGEHRLNDWRFEFDSAVRRAGCCHWPMAFGPGKITMSRKFVELNDVDQVEQVMLHEIAHALAGHEAGHGRKWKLTAMNIGCRSLSTCAVPDAVPVPTRWIGRCPTPGCGVVVRRQEMSARARRVACSKCCAGKYDEKYKFVWEDTKQLTIDGAVVEAALRTR